MRVIVCGGRDYDDWQAVRRVLSTFHRGVVIVHGDARGADTLAKLEAIQIGLLHEAFPADWERYGRAAGPIRNRQMLGSGADLVVAFPGGPGTADMCKQAEAAGVLVLRAGA